MGEVGSVAFKTNVTVRWMLILGYPPIREPPVVDPRMLTPTQPFPFHLDLRNELAR